ncbi:hypothetical protein D3C81_1383760 [compost metagenome]
MRHAIDTQRHGGNRRDGPGADFALMPQPQGIAAGAHDQRDHQRLVDDLELADQAHLAKAGKLEILHRRACEVGLAFGVREQFHGGDVGVGVRDAPGHRRPRMGLFLPDLPQAWHKVQHGQTEQYDPGNKRQHQFQGKTAGQCNDRDEINPDSGGDLDDGEQDLAHGECRLHHLGRHPAGELIGKE